LRTEGYLVLVVAGFSVGVLLARAPYDAALASQMRHDISQYVDVLILLCRASIVVGVFTLWKPGLIVWSLSSTFSALVGIALLRWQAHRQVPGFHMTFRSISRNGFRDIAGMTGYTSALRVADWIALSGTPLMLSYLLGPSAVAHLAPAIAIVAMFQPLARSFLTQLLPVVARANVVGEQVRIQRTFLEGARFGLLTTGAAAALIASLADPLIAAWLGPGFEDTARVLRLLCLGEIAQASVGAAFPIWLGIGRLRVPAAIALGAAFIGIAAGAWLISEMGLGLVGAGIGLVGAQLIRVTTEWWRAATILGIRVRAYLRESLVGPVTSLLAGVAVSSLVQWSLDRAPFLELVAAAFAGGLAISALAWTIGLRPLDRERLVEHLRSGLASSLPRR
jgi:O-antigen/teichoic acid export membrane protein